MRMTGDHGPIHELTLLVTPEEAREVIRVLNQLLEVVPSERPISENEIDDAPNPYVGGERTLRLVVYADPIAEQRHDAKYTAP
jgi:succinylarginine dihydrolase